MEQSPSQDSEELGPQGTWDDFREGWRSYQRHQRTETPHNTETPDNTEEQDIPSYENPEEMKKREIRKAGEEAMRRLDTLADELEDKEQSSDFSNENEQENKEYKKAKKQELKEMKYKIQEYDTVLDKGKGSKEKSPPLSTNRNWREVRSVYRRAWEDLQSWGIERNVWDEYDTKEYIQEMEALRYPKNWEKTRGIISLGLYSVYAVNKLFFEQTLKHADMLGSDFDIYKNYEKSAKMIDAWIHPKPEKGRGEKKPEKISAKEHENNIKIREIHIKLARKNREEMEQEGIFEGENKKEYGEFWRKLRVYYIREGAWDKNKEREFREELHDLGPEFGLQRRDLLSENERKEMNEAPGKKAKKENELRNLNAAPQPLNEQQLSRRIKLEAEIEEINNRVEEIERNEENRRNNEDLWPPYDKSGRRRQGGGIMDIDLGTNETQADENQTNNESTP